MAEDGENRRSAGRLGVQLPVRVQGYDPDGTHWEEMTTGDDISAGGAAFPLRHLVVKGQAVLLSMPLPKRYRSYDLAEASYHVYALIRKVDVTDRGIHIDIGVMFIGKNAPRGFEENPGARYLLPGEKAPAAPGAAGRPVERRREEPTKVRNVYVGKDGIPRLNLRFVDAEAPDWLIG